MTDLQSNTLTDGKQSSEPTQPIERLVLACIEAGIVLKLKDGKLSVRAPKESDVSELIERIKARRDDLEQYLRDDADRERRIAMGPVRHPDNDSVLSSGQERLWFLFQLEEDPTTYNMFGAYKVIGKFEYNALDAALQAIMFRHSVFRSYMESYDGEVIQKTAPVSRVHIPVDDYSDMEPEEREAAVMEWLESESEFAFDLSSYPLWRFRLVKISAEEHLLAFSVHHILCDGLSELVLLGELGYWYEAFKADPDTDVPEVSVRYCDFAAWQKVYLGSKRYLEDLAWWKTNLAGANPMLEVPTDRPRPPLGSQEGSWVHFRIEKEITEGLWQVGRDAGTTTFMVGLTLFGLMLRDFSGQDDLVVGTPVSNRNHPDLEQLVGFFVNSVPIRLRLDGDLTFRQLVEAVSGSTLESFDHQHVPFEKLVEELGVRRDPSFNPIFQSMFAMEDAKELDAAEQIGSLKLQALEIPEESSMFDLDLLLQGFDSGHLEGGFNFNTDLYDHATIERMSAHFQKMAEAVSANPDVSISELASNVNASDENLAIGVGESVEYNLDTTIDARIAEITKQNPDVVAIEHNGATATYIELEEMAAQFTQELKEMGVGEGQIVAVELPRGIPFLAAIIGVLRCDAAYVPIDPEYPVERRSYMVEDSQSAVHITVAGDEKEASLTVAGSDLVLSPRPGAGAVTPPLEGQSPIAYMIYTSGSTGRPKGAMVRHDGALNHIDAEVDVLGVDDDFVFLQTAASSSDISVWQFFGPLVYGGRTVIVDTHTQLDPVELLDLTQRSEATIIELVPSVVQLLVEYANTLEEADRAMPKLRSMMITGEAAPVPTVNGWLELYPHVPVVNAYGPTEAADDVCQAVIAEPLPEDALSVPIGTAINNMSIYVLDKNLKPVPLGAAGQICISGVGVGAGYLGQPEKTESSFVENPYASSDVERYLYLTGDRGRWLRDGQLDFLGRMDEQVKVRGFRLELGEITACVVSEDRVREAATVLADGATGEKVLVSYYSTIDGEDLSSSELRDHLRTILPVQIIPNMLIHLDELPHLPNGKIDTRNLPRPEMAIETVEDAREATETETAVREIWCSLLGVPQVPLDADFFDWGGDSLMVVKMLGRTRERFNKEVRVGEFFAKPNLADFCAFLDATAEMVDSIDLVAANKTRYPLSPGQARLWFLDLFEEGSSTYNMPGAMHFKGNLDLKAFTAALTRLVQRHPSMRTRIDVENGTPYQEIMESVPVDVELIDLSDLDEETAKLTVAGRIQDILATEFDLAEAPLWRFELLQVADNNSYLLNVIHHIVTDGLSNEVLIGELVTFYAMELMGSDDDLEPLEYNYGDYAEWQLSLQKTNRHRRQQLYWERKLEGAPVLLDLPTDFPRPSTQTYNGGEVEFDIDAELADQLRDLAKANGATMFMVVQAAMAVLLRTYSGQDDIVVGTPLGGRPLAELEAVVGFFVNTVVIRSEIDSEASFIDLLGQVRTTCIEAFDHSDVPFEQIVERVQAERNPSFSPVFQVMVGYEDDKDQEEGLEGIDIDVVEFDEKAAMFDLDVLFDDNGDDGLNCAIVYNVDLFTNDTVTQMGQHLLALLKRIVTDPTSTIEAFDVLDEGHLAELNQLGTGPTPAWNHDRTIIEMVADSAKANPTKVAITDANTSVTYEALEAEAAWLSRTLTEHGVTPGDFVAIMDDRSAVFATAIVGVMWSGAAYVPVDPNYPAGRVAHMLNDSSVEVVITSEARLAEVLEAIDQDGPDRTVLVLPASVEAEVAESEVAELVIPIGTTVVRLEHPEEFEAAQPPAAVAPTSPAYLLYTSGSTGMPKGAIVTHRGQLNHILGEAEVLGLDNNTVIAQTAPASSDISVWQFVGPLVLGGSTSVIATEELIQPECLLERLERDSVTLIEFVPAVFDHVLDYVDNQPDEDKTHSLEVLAKASAAMITGEAAPVATVNRWLEAVPNVPMINAYGPTEASDDVAQHAITTPLDEDALSVPIGIPLPGVTLLVLDEQQRQVPRGVRGEICIAGVCVADGYWRRPEQTAEVFIENPYATSEFDTKLYRTGDIGRWNRDGVLEYSGRVDGQVNLLGTRIELGEIESAISALVGVKEAAVIVSEEGPKRLVAFWVAGDGEPTEDEMEEQLADRLPVHMVPQTWVRLAALPRTPMGKVDRPRLPVGAAEAAFAAREYVAPEGDEEVRLAEIWSAVLEVEQVSVNDDFFELGGNSLAAVETVRRIGEAFGVKLPLVDFFRTSTLNGTLATIERLKAAEAASEAELDDLEL